VGEWVETIARGLERFSAELTFRTSGSTGQPKWCVHELADLETEVAESARWFAGCRRVLGAVPSHHIYGFLFTILLPARLGCAYADVRAHAPARLAGLVESGDVVVGFPDFWRAFVRTVPHVAPGALGVSSTAPCPADVASGVRAAGIERLIEVYGSSETAGVGWRDDPQSAYELFTFWRRGAGERGLIRRRPDGTERPLLAPDVLEWDGPRHVRPAGRTEGAVQVGGINVFPERVGAVLRAHAGVDAAIVRLMRPDEGERLKAFVVPQPGYDRGELLAALWTHIDARLSPAERPKSIVFGERLPVSTLGKLADWPIADVASTSFVAEGGSFPPEA
jgi:4-coumarate--CoA ligase (photoactive yellow protein activation family)